LTINGSGFGTTQSSSIVTVGGVTAIPTSWTDTKIIAPVPGSLLPGFADVIVTVGGAASNAQSFLVIPVITSVSPDHAPINGSVTVTGTSFGDTHGTSSTITFHGLNATPSAWTNTSVSFPIPVGATSGTIIVTVNGWSTNGADCMVLPTINTLSPSSGPTGGIITITGSGFGAVQNFNPVTIGGVSVTPTSWSDTSIAIPVPTSLPAGNANVVVTVNTRASNGINFTVIADTTPPTITATVLPTPNPAGWNNSQVGVLFACADDQSGVASCPSLQTISTEGASQAVSGTATDNAGNNSSTSVSLNIDMTPPVFAVTSPSGGSSVSVSTASIAGTVSDLLSGVASVQCNGIAAALSPGSFLCQVSLNPGLNQVQIVATDIAGNQAPGTLNITSLAPPPVPINAIFITPS
jgi:hypothetical protein